MSQQQRNFTMKTLCIALVIQALICAAYGLASPKALPTASHVYDPQGFSHPVSRESLNYKWKEMGRNKAAVSSDCLYVSHGPDGSLAECEAACANQTLCNAINYNAELPDCVFRACRNPEDPDLTRTSGYNCYTIDKKFVPMPSNSSLVKLVSSPHYLSRWSGRNITFFGDSITWLDTYLGDLSDAISNSKQTRKLDLNLINRGINGGTIQDIRNGGTYFGETYPSFSEALKMDKPALVSIQIGINDVWWPERNDSSKLPEFKQILTALIHEVKSMNISIYISTVSVIGEQRDGQNHFDHTLDAFAAGQVQVGKETGTFVNNLRHAYLAYDAKENVNDAFSGILTYDGVHPTGYGAQLLANHHAQGLLSFTPN